MNHENEFPSLHRWLTVSVTDLWKIHFVRFMLVGIVNTLFSYLIYALLLFLGLNYAIANLLALMIGLVFGFRTQGKLVFNNQDHRVFWRFILCWAVIYGVNITLISGIMTLGLDAYIAGVLAIPPTALISYLAQKYLVFRPSVTC